jgi:hypothetical protein
MHQLGRRPHARDGRALIATDDIASAMASSPFSLVRSLTLGDHHLREPSAKGVEAPVTTYAEYNYAGYQIYVMCSCAVL